MWENKIDEKVKMGQKIKEKLLKSMLFS